MMYYKSLHVVRGSRQDGGRVRKKFRVSRSHFLDPLRQCGSVCTGIVLKNIPVKKYRAILPPCITYRVKVFEVKKRKWINGVEIILELFQGNLFRIAECSFLAGGVVLVS